MTVHVLPRPHARPNALLRRLASLVPLTMDDLLAVSRLTEHVRSAPPGVDLIQPGLKLDHTIIVLDGFVCRYKIRKDGRRQNLACLLAGDLSDLDGVIFGRATHAAATLSLCTYVQMPVADLLDLIEHHPRVTRALRMAKLIDEAIMREWIMQLGRYSATERMAHLFCELFVRLQAVGLVQDGSSYKLPLSQHVLSETLGLSGVHVNRSLQALRQDGWITFKHGRLHIHDLDSLKAHAEFSNDYLGTSFTYRALPGDPVSAVAAEV